jgi:hypothetical protein
MKRALWPLLATLALGAGCRGPGWYADKSPLDIAEMVEVELASLGPGEAGYRAPEIAGDRRYHLAGRKDLDSGETRHALRLSEFGSAEDRYHDWAEASAEGRTCRLRDAGGPAQHMTFATIDHRTSCTPYQDCETYERYYKKKYKDDDGNKKTKIVERTFRDCRDLWRCQSERRYEVKIDDRTLREAVALPDGMQVELGWDCGGKGLHREVLELPASYVQGYLLAIEGHPLAPRPKEASEP